MVGWQWLKVGVTRWVLQGVRQMMTRGVKKYRSIKARHKRLRFIIRAQGHVISVRIHKAKAHQLRGHHEVYVCAIVLCCIVRALV